MAKGRNNLRRRRGRGRFGPLLKLLCALSVVAALTFGATVFFKLEQVTVSGNSRYTQEEVVTASGIQTGDNLYRLNKYQIKDEILRTLPYVEGVNIVRDLPSTIVITVYEWDAVARIQAPKAGKIPDGESGEDPLAVATEDWLISVGGKLLEPAPADSTAILVTGITPVLPRAGTMLALPQAEEAKNRALLDLLGQLEELDMMSRVTAIHLDATQVLLRYEDCFDVKLPLTADFNYKLRALEAVVRDTRQKLGEEIGGTFDMTQEGYTAMYSPG